MIIYLDTDALANVARSDADQRVIRAAIERDDLTLSLSIVTLDETLALIDVDPEQAARQLRLIVDLADRRMLIKPYDRMVTDDVRAYARGDAAPEP